MNTKGLCVKGLDATEISREFCVFISQDVFLASLPVFCCVAVFVLAVV